MNLLSVLRELPDVRRAWPGKEGSLSFETFDDIGRLRAGRITAEGKVELADFAVDPKLPELDLQMRGTLVVHRLHRRAVVLGEQRVSKLLRRGRASQVVAATGRFAELVQDLGVVIPEVLEASDSRVDFALLPGLSLFELGPIGIPGWQEFARLWPRLVARPVDLPAHTGTDEAEVLWRWFQWAEQFQALPDLAPLEAATRRTCRELSVGQDPLVLTHRDLHDKQVMWDGLRLGLLDLDTAARAEAALDISNLRAHVELREMQGRWPTSLRWQVSDLLAEVAEQLPASAERISVYYRASLLRLTFVYAFRPNAAQWLPQWVDHCLGQF